MPKYYLTNKAKDDLSEIWNYTYEVWSENQADKYYHELIDICKYLSENQNLGRNYTEILINIFGFKIGQDIIFYSILNSDEITIIRILHSKMDLKNRIRE